MTCIVGLVEGGDVWVAGDSAGVAEWDMMVRADAKVFRNGPMIFGFTSSFRMGQLLRHALVVPAHDPALTDEGYLATVFIDAVRELLKSRGFAEKKNQQESGGTFVLGYNGRVYSVHDDYQVCESRDGFLAVGCGKQIAHGALYALRSSGLSAPRRLQVALEAAERFSAGVRAPFVVECLPARPRPAFPLNRVVRDGELPVQTSAEKPA